MLQFRERILTSSGTVFDKVVHCTLIDFCYSPLLVFYYSRVSNRRGGRNKREGWQISAKIINTEGAINGEVGKNLQS